MSSDSRLNDLAISVEDVSKVYRLGLREQQQDSVGASIIATIRSPLQNLRKYRSLYKFTADELAAIDSSEQGDDLLWALRHVSMNIEQGEVVGIVGHNGAGKSTLLKILTKITPPTTGKLRIRGRVSSLLEVGTGFHQELTGRENVYLNGTILGMRKREVDQKFEEIVEFSGVHKFLDTPVKRYSSGMRVRLAFAVAAHLEPEILIIDEVLAVGDAAFQRQCIDKMQDVGKSGRTVLFVSHNLPAVSMLCSRAILLESGRLTADGPTNDVLERYLSRGRQESFTARWDDPSERPGDEVARLVEVTIRNSNGMPTDEFSVSESVSVEMIYDVLRPRYRLLPNFSIFNDQGQALFRSFDQSKEWQSSDRPVGRYRSTMTIPGNYLTPGHFRVSAKLHKRQPDKVEFFVDNAVAFSMNDAMGPGTARGDWPGPFHGVVRPVLPWRTDYATSDDNSALLETVDAI